MSGSNAPKPKSPKGRAKSLAAVAIPWVGLAAMTGLWVRAIRKPRPGLSQQAIAAPEHFDEAEPGRGRLADAPRLIPARGWRDIAWRTWLEITADRLPAVAGGITFYTLLAIFPAVGVFVSLYGLFADAGAVSKHLVELSAFVPRQVLSMLGDQMIRLATQRHATLSVAFVVSLLLSLWSANNGVAALFDGLNVAYDEVEKRNFFVLRARTMAFTVALLLFVTAVTAILVVTPLLLGALGLADSLFVPFRWVVLLLLAGVAFAVVYRFGPSRAQARWRWVRWGAAFAALAWIGGSLGFSWFLNNVAHYDATYGPLSAVVGFMMWIWFSAMVVLIGAELNAEIEHQTAVDSTTGAPLPMGQRGAAMADTVGLAFEGLHKLMSGTRNRMAKPPARKPPSGP